MSPVHAEQRTPDRSTPSERSEEGSVAPIIVLVEAGLQLDAARLHDAISQELHVPVISLSHRDARRAAGTLMLTRASERGILFVFRHVSGREVWRVLELGETLESTYRAAALLAGNLVRDQASEILDELGIVEPTVVEPSLIDAEPPVETEGDDVTDNGESPNPPQEVGEEARQRAWAEARRRSFNDAWAFEAHLVGVFAVNMETPRATARVGHRWGAFGLSLAESSGRLTTCTWSECLTIGQHSLSLEASYRLRAGPLVAEFGLGVGARLNRINGPRGSSIEYAPVGHLQILVAVAVARGVDLVAGTSAGTTFYAINFPAFYGGVELSPWEIGMSMGIRIHL